MEPTSCLDILYSLVNVVTPPASALSAGTVVAPDPSSSLYAVGASPYTRVAVPLKTALLAASRSLFLAPNRSTAALTRSTVRPYGVSNAMGTNQLPPNMQREGPKLASAKSRYGAGSPPTAPHAGDETQSAGGVPTSDGRIRRIRIDLWEQLEAAPKLCAEREL